MMFVALTFDDGTLHQYSLLRLLHKLNIRATIFCITNLKKHPDTNKKLLASKPQKIYELYKMGHVIASHTCTHPNLKFLTSEKLRKELEESKHMLENIIGDEVLGFAYPYSQYNGTVLEEVKKEYFYARGGTLPRDPLNMNIYDKYRISSIGVKKTIILPFGTTYKKNRNRALIVIMMHDVPISIMYSLILYLKMLFNPLFLTMKEIAFLIEERAIKK